jgi:hypothetical protein
LWLLSFAGTETGYLIEKRVRNKSIALQKKGEILKQEFISAIGEAFANPPLYPQLMHRGAVFAVFTKPPHCADVWIIFLRYN